MGEEKMKISDIKGVGPKLAERIQQTLDIESLEQMLELTEEELKEVKGIGSGKAEKIFNSLEELGEECDRCDQKFLDQDTCPKCTAELEEELEPIRKEVEYFKNDNFSGERWELEKNLEKIDSELSEGRFEEVEELMESVEQELAEAQDLSDKLSKIEKKLEDKKVINLSTYREELELARDYMRYRDYEEGHNRAEKILDYLGEEKRYQDLDTSELLEESVEEFGRHMMGVGTRAGEKIYGSGLRALKDVYNAEQEELQKEAGIEESTAKIVIDALDSLFEDIEIEREVEEETLPESEDQKTVKEEKVFEDTKEEE
ncbi:MAG: helix-hairpin-helix domain-containing protein, partial [Candidatus Natronoplasma sp.]